jgi:hypothetical protein
MQACLPIGHTQRRRLRAGSRRCHEDDFASRSYLQARREGNRMPLSNEPAE